MKNSVMLASDKKMYRISYISNKFIPLSLIILIIIIDGHVLY
jgi:hypothetical protein